MNEIILWVLSLMLSLGLAVWIHSMLFDDDPYSRAINKITEAKSRQVSFVRLKAEEIETILDYMNDKGKIIVRGECGGFMFGGIEVLHEGDNDIEGNNDTELPFSY